MQLVYNGYSQENLTRKYRFMKIMSCIRLPLKVRKPHCIYVLQPNHYKRRSFIPLHLSTPYMGRAFYFLLLHVFKLINCKNKSATWTCVGRILKRIGVEVLILAIGTRWHCNMIMRNQTRGHVQQKDHSYNFPNLFFS